MKIYVDVSRTIGGDILFLDAKNLYDYVDGKKTNKVIGTNVYVVLLDRNFEKINVKLIGIDLSELEKINSNDKIQFKEIEGIVYDYNNHIRVSYKAGGIEKNNNNSLPKL